MLISIDVHLASRVLLPPSRTERAAETNRAREKVSGAGLLNSSALDLVSPGTAGCPTPVPRGPPKPKRIAPWFAEPLLRYRRRGFRVDSIQPLCFGRFLTLCGAHAGQTPVSSGSAGCLTPVPLGRSKPQRICHGVFQTSLRYRRGGFRVGRT